MGNLLPSGQHATVALTVRSAINLVAIAVCSWFLAATVIQRTKKGLGKGRRFIVSLVLSLWLQAFVNFFSYIQDWRTAETPCWVLGMASQYTTCCVVLWSVAVSYYLYDSIMTQRPSKMSEFKTNVFAWCGPVPSTIVPWFTDSYGMAGQWCWINIGQADGRLLLFVTFYIPTWICIIVVCWLHIRLAKRVFQIKRQQALRVSQQNLTATLLAPAISSVVDMHGVPDWRSGDLPRTPSVGHPTPTSRSTFNSAGSVGSARMGAGDNDPSSRASVDSSVDPVQQYQRRSRKLKPRELVRYTVKKMAPFPIIFLLCWIFPTARRVLQAAGYSPQWLVIAHAASAPCQGVLTPLFYFRRPIRRRAKCMWNAVAACCVACWCCCRSRSAPRDGGPWRTLSSRGSQMSGSVNGGFDRGRGHSSGRIIAASFGRGPSGASAASPSSGGEAGGPMSGPNGASTRESGGLALVAGASPPPPHTR